jgi:hypothetical protein
MSEEESRDPQDDRSSPAGNNPPRTSNPSQSRGRIGGAVKGAAREGGKQAAIQGAKGAAQGAAKGARAGAAAGSVVPVVGTAIGGALGALGGAAIGGSIGAAKGGAKGAASGARSGAAKGVAKMPPSGGDPRNRGVAGKINSIAEKVSEKGAEMVGKRVGGEIGGKIAKGTMKKYNDAVKKVVPSAEGRLALRAAAGILGSGPVGWGVAGAIFFIIFLITVVMGGPSAADPNAAKLTITKSGPTEAISGAELEYRIAVAYPAQAKDIMITDRLPEGTEFISTDQKATCDNGECNSSSRVVTWNLKDFIPLENDRLNNVNTVIILMLRATADNAFLVNIAEGSLTPYTAPPISGDNGPIADGFVPAQPHSNDCNGKYDFSQWPDENPLGNYGDPQCNFSKDNLYKHLEAKETNPEFVNIWFNMVVPVESGYSPNAFAPPVGIQCSLDCAGAWGLYQMGSSNPPGQSPPAPGKNGELDRGDLNWEIQTTMAISYNRDLLNCNYRYWASAMKVWGKYSC